MLHLHSHTSRIASGAAACPTRAAAQQRSACRATRRDADATPLPEATSALSRRDVLAATVASTLLVASSPAAAVQGYVAGRIPGVSNDPDEEGFYTYTRPEGKQGGHGVGWSEIPQYSFKVPEGWVEVPVSIADLGGTEIDLRFQSKEEGNLQVVVAPVLRFADVGFNANVRIEKLAPPENIIAGFGPELFGQPVVEEDVEKTEVRARAGLTYYHWEVKPRRLVTATATGNRVFLMAVTANPRQWRKYEEILREISLSFTVPPVNV